MRLSRCFAALVLLLSACGGGNNDGSSSPVLPSAPLVVAGPDPLLPKQWHLFNTGQSGGIPGMDIGLNNLTETGQGVLIAFIDGAVQINHPDLVANLFSLNGFLPTTDPSPPAAPANAPYDNRPGGWDDAHGTAVVGIAVASWNNGIGGRGVAPGAAFIALNGIVGGRVGAALKNAVDIGADVVNNSWGSLDQQDGQGGSYQAADPTWIDAVKHALAKGRQGRGTIVIAAAGNGGRLDDSNRDGYANQLGVFAVGAVDHRGQPPSFAEPGANILVSAPSMSLLERNTGQAEIWTTDIVGPRGLEGSSRSSNDDYAAFAGGTSAAAPMVSGVVALMLQANTLLTWRDVRWLLAKTARPSDLGTISPEPSPMTMHGFHPLVGFGRVHAADAVKAARGFVGLPTERQCDSGLLIVDQPIEDAPAPGVKATYRFTDCTLKIVESVQITLTVDHLYGADLEVILTSPNKTKSVLAKPHFCNPDTKRPCGDLSAGWVFHSIRHLGEVVHSPGQSEMSQTWDLDVRDRQSGDSGRWRAWRILLTGH